MSQRRNNKRRHHTRQARRVAVVRITRNGIDCQNQKQLKAYDNDPLTYEQELNKLKYEHIQQGG